MRYDSPATAKINRMRQGIDVPQVNANPFLSPSEFTTLDDIYGPARAAEIRRQIGVTNAKTARQGER